MALVTAQTEPPQTMLIDLYTTTAQTVISSLLVCNKNTIQGTFRIAIRLNNALITDAAYIYYDCNISAKDTFITTVGLTLPTNTVISVYSNIYSMNFHLFGDSI